MHLFQAPAVGYDPLPDFKKACELMIKLRPDILVFAGDMFDYKRSFSSFVRWFEGEGRMISVRPLLEKLGVNIYAIRGNHEREEIVKGIAQTVSNFKYAGDSHLEENGTKLWFLNTRYEKGSAEAEKAIERVCQEARKSGGVKILVTHESMGGGADSLSDDTIRLASETFDFVFNGHCHIWKKLGQTGNVYLLPALLPSGLRLGSYWIERYSWEADKETFQKECRSSPFGLVLLETDRETVEFVPLEPSRRIVEVSVGADGLSPAEVKRRFDEVLGQLKNAVVFPELHGAATFPPEVIGRYLGEKGDWVGELKSEVRFASVSGGEIALPQVVDLGELIREHAQKLTEKSRCFEAKDVSTAFLNLLEDGRLANPRSSPADRLRDVLGPLLQHIHGSRPKFFERDLQELLSFVRKVRT